MNVRNVQGVGIWLLAVAIATKTRSRAAKHGNSAVMSTEPCLIRQNHTTLSNFVTYFINRTYHLQTWGTALLPKIPFNTAMALPTMISSETFSSLFAASPATRAMRTGDLYRFQKRNSSPRFAVVLPTWPKRFVFGSQNTRSKHRTTYTKKKCQRHQILKTSK